MRALRQYKESQNLPPINALTTCLTAVQIFLVARQFTRKEIMGIVGATTSFFQMKSALSWSSMWFFQNQ